MKQSIKDKIKKTKEEGRKKIMDLCGYEIWRDPLNYTTFKDNNTLYFSTFKNALQDIRNEIIRKDLKGAKTLDNAIMVINDSDIAFTKALVEALDGLGQEFNEKTSPTKASIFQGRHGADLQ